MGDTDPYHQLVIGKIISIKDLEIMEVNNIESIKSLIFRQEDYKLIASLIKKRKWQQISDTEQGPSELREYLEIIKFSDQNGNVRIATIYDSDELWQDPQVIEIFPLDEK